MTSDLERTDVDPLDELRAVREQYAAKFNYDFDAIYRDLKEKERLSGQTYVCFSDQPEDSQRELELMTARPREFGMTGDPIVDEIRKHRNEHAAKFNYDIKAVFNDLRERQRTGGREILFAPPRPLRIDAETANVPVSNDPVL